MESQGIWNLFNIFNKKYFWGKLDRVRLSWSPQMTLCAGKTAYRVKGHSIPLCTIRLSQPILSQRPHSDTVNTLLHEMIHAYLHVTQGLNYRDSHGPEFRNHMKRINDLQGSKITIYHNFKREVDKFRIHVYRCDGPCISKRPYYGILRRAITRPPDSTDRWWARHERECGGTFHKIDGPGPVPNAGLKTEMKTKQMIHPKASASLNAPSNKYQYSDKYKTRLDGITGTQSSGTVLRQSEKGKQSLSSFNRESFNEDQILQRIKAKYSNTKQSILLSKEETKNALRGCPENRSKRGKSPEVGTLVDGNVNPNYISKSPHMLNIQKYLYKYLEAKKLQCHVPHEPKVITVKSKSKVPDTIQKYMVPYEPKVLTVKSKSKVPDIIQKYMNRLHEAKNLKSHLPEPNYKSSGHVVSCTSPSGVVSEDKLSESLSKKSKKNELLDLDSFSTSVCPICNSSVAATAYEQHLQECFGDDLDLDIDVPCEEERTEKDNNCSAKSTTKEIRKVENERNQLEAKSCPNCGCLVLLAEMKVHLQYCIDSEDDDVDIESPGKSPDKNKNERGLLDSFHEVDGVVTCPSCMEKVKENCIQEHLDECLKLLSEEF